MTKEEIEAAFQRVDGLYDNDARFFLDRCERYPHLAKSPTSVKPPIVPGDHLSVRLSAGWRVWGFRDRGRRDRFIVQFGGRRFP